MLAVVENIIDGRLNAQYHDFEGSARQETSPLRRARGRSNPSKRSRVFFLRSTLAIPRRNLKPRFVLMCSTSFLFNI
jgi:hypothetical protein